MYKSGYLSRIFICTKSSINLAVVIYNVYDHVLHLGSWNGISVECSRIWWILNAIQPSSAVTCKYTLRLYSRENKIGFVVFFFIAFVSLIILQETRVNRYIALRHHVTTKFCSLWHQQLEKNSACKFKKFKEKKTSN